MACTAMASIVMAYIIVAYAVMAYTVMLCIFMAYIVIRYNNGRRYLEQLSLAPNPHAAARPALEDTTHPACPPALTHARPQAPMSTCTHPPLRMYRWQAAAMSEGAPWRKQANDLDVRSPRNFSKRGLKVSVDADGRQQKAAAYQQPATWAGHASSKHGSAQRRRSSLAAIASHIPGRSAISPSLSIAGHNYIGHNSIAISI